MSKITAFKCHNCNGMGRVSYETPADEDADLGASIISRPCEVCNGSRVLTKAELMSRPADATFSPEEFLPIPLTGSFRVYIDGKIYQRKMTSRQLFKLANYALQVALETQNYEKADQDG